MSNIATTTVCTTFTASPCKEIVNSTSPVCLIWLFLCLCIILLANLHITALILASHHSFSPSMITCFTSLHLALEWCSIKPQDVNKTLWLLRWDEWSQESSVISSITGLIVHSLRHSQGGNGSVAYRDGHTPAAMVGTVHRTIRFLLCCGQHWWIVGGRLSVCVRVYQHLSCLLLRCGGCCLTALPRLLHISQLGANLERKQKPTHCCCRPDPYYYSILSAALCSPLGKGCGVNHHLGIHRISTGLGNKGL